MESLLRWGIEHSTPTTGQQRPAVDPKDLDPAIIDMILGKPDAEQMKEDLAVAVDQSRSEDERINALDHLEMLIEQIDNANNLEKLDMWKSLHSLLTEDTSTNDIIMQTLWVIGTALQNNPAAQDSYFKLDPLPVLTSLLASNLSTPAIRSKVLYALSGLLKHNAPALTALDAGGWIRLRDSLQDPDITVRRKAAFLLNTLLTPTTELDPPRASSSSSVPIHANSHASHLANPDRTKTSPTTLSAMKEHCFIPAIIEGLIHPLPYGEDGEHDEPDADFEEKSVGVIKTYVTDCGEKLDDVEKASLKGWIEKQPSQGLAERLGFSVGELQGLIDRVQ